MKDKTDVVIEELTSAPDLYAARENLASAARTISMLVGLIGQQHAILKLAVAALTVLDEKNSYAGLLKMLREADSRLETLSKDTLDLLENDKE